MLHNGKFCKRPKSDATLEDNHINYGPHMDPLMIPLCDSFNTILGLQTTESCEGHFKQIPGGQPKTFITFMVDDIKTLNLLNRITWMIRMIALNAKTWTPNVDVIPYWDLVFMPPATVCDNVEYEGQDKIRCTIECNVRSVKEREALFNNTKIVLDDVSKGNW